MSRAVLLGDTPCPAPPAGPAQWDPATRQWQKFSGDIMALAGGQRAEWIQRGREIDTSGEATNLNGLYTGLQALPLYSPPSAVTGVTARTALWAAGTFTPLPATNTLQPGAWWLSASGVVTSSAASQTITMTPGIGTTTGAGSLGASTALALGSTITNALWTLNVYLTIRRVDGANASAYAMSEMRFGTTAGASATVTTALFGNTAVTFDQTAAAGATAGGLEIDVTPSATGVSMQPTIINWLSL